MEWFAYAFLTAGTAISLREKKPIQINQGDVPKDSDWQGLAEKVASAMGTKPFDKNSWNWGWGYIVAALLMPEIGLPKKIAAHFVADKNLKTEWSDETVARHIRTIRADHMRMLIMAGGSEIVFRVTDNFGKREQGASAFLASIISEVDGFPQKTPEIESALVVLREIGTDVWLQSDERKNTITIMLMGIKEQIKLIANDLRRRPLESLNDSEMFLTNDELLGSRLIVYEDASRDIQELLDYLDRYGSHSIDKKTTSIPLTC